MQPDLVPSSQPSELALPGAELIPFPSGRYSIPPEEMGEFSRLAMKEQERVKFLLSLFARMEVGGVVATSEALGFQLRHQRGFGANNLRALYYKWQDGGWKMLPRQFTNGGEKLPAEFVDHFRALCEKNGRSLRQAMNALSRAWHSGESIPGYGTWREWFLTQWPDRDMPTVCPGTPKGWGKSNLYVLQPTKAQRALKTKGFAAAKGFLPSLVRDTSNLMPLQLIAIDDFEIDQLCFYWDPEKKTRAICRMAGVAAMDVATRRILGLVLKPRLEGDDGVKQSITRAEVRLLLFQLLRDYGVPAHGMTILCENAAAAVTTELELTFRNLFGGKVEVTRTNMIDGKVLANGFVERGGKPWLKGWIESAFNLMHNIAANLEGQKGASYMVKPGDLEEKKRVAERLIGFGSSDAQLSDEQLSRARVPFLRHTELHDAYIQLFQIMEHRTDHVMIGFERVIEWRMHESQPWQHVNAMGALTQMEQLSVKVRDRAQSPRERWAALIPAAKLARVPDHVLMMLLLTPKRAKLNGHKLTFAHNKMGFTYIVPPSSPIAQERQGVELLCYFDPTRPHHAHICKLDGRLLGEVERLGAVDIGNVEAITEAERTIGELFNSVLNTVRARPLHREEERHLIESKQINDALVQEAAALRNANGITKTLARMLPDHVEAMTANADRVAQEIANIEKQKAAEQSLRTHQAKAMREVSRTEITDADRHAANDSREPSTINESFSDEEISRLLSDS